jgi:hypothetical protein
MKMKLCSLNVYEGDKEGGHGHFCAFKHTGNEFCEFNVLRTPEVFPRGRWTTKSIVDSVDDDIYCITYYISGDLDINELEDSWRVCGRVDETELVDR